MAAFQSADDRLLINEVPFVTLWDNVDYSATFSDRLSKGSRGTACDTDMDGLGRSPIQDRHSQVLVRITMDHDPRNPAYISAQGPLSSTVADFWQATFPSNWYAFAN
ncbi:receptor-type tyrosine-protein phosphatase N2 [Tachysurus ichikawai]